MAKLDDLTKSLNIDIPIIQNQQKVSNSGYKRRAWLDNESEKENNQKGSINPIYQPHLSTPLINPIDQPLSQKGFIKGAHRPLLISFQDLRSNPLKIAQYIFENSIHHPEKFTGKITQTEIMQMLNLTKDSARTGMRFLLKNKIVERIDFKIGKTGWSKYKLRDDVFQAFQEAHQKGSIAPIKQKGFNNSSNNITTTEYRPLFNWDHIDITSLAHIGFTKKHLQQLKENNSPEAIQESIQHFAYGLKFNPKLQKYDNPLSVLMGVLRKGIAWVENGYKSDKELAQEQLIKNKQEQQERLKKLHDTAYELAFNDWHKSLTKEEIEKIAPKNSSLNQDGFMPQKVRMSLFFKENIWPLKKGEFNID